MSAASPVRVNLDSVRSVIENLINRCVDTVWGDSGGGRAVATLPPMGKRHTSRRESLPMCIFRL